MANLTQCILDSRFLSIGCGWRSCSGCSYSSTRTRGNTHTNWSPHYYLIHVTCAGGCCIYILIIIIYIYIRTRIYYLYRCLLYSTIFIIDYGPLSSIIRGMLSSTICPNWPAVSTGSVCPCGRGQTGGFGTSTCGGSAKVGPVP